MRIAIPIHAFEPGGVERVGLRLAERWQEEGHDVAVVLGRDRGTCREDRPALDYRTFREPIPTAGWETIWMMLCLLRFLMRERPDVIFCPGLTYTAPCVVARLLLGQCCPPVVVKVSNDLDRPDMSGPLAAPYRAWLSLQGRLLDHFVAIGAPMREPVASALQIKADRVSVIPDPALSQAECAGLAKLAGRKANDRAGRSFLAVGRLVPQKNFALLLRAFAAMASPGDRLAIAGEGPCRAALEREAGRLGIAAQLTMPGHVHDMTALYRDADVLVLSSDYEGVPAVVIEALAAGLPIAATDCCASMAWLAGDGAFGRLAPRGDAAALARAMVEASKLDPPQEDRRCFAADFTLERASQHYLGLFAEACEAQAPEKSGEQVREPRGGGVCQGNHHHKA
ncbi:glycosyltransferase [Alteraurantiacibacter aquimixticola]|nr:glycosyltransferase [Alteraurantiacibacter aquimixticola]